MEIREKIAQLREVTVANGATEAEALAALGMAAKLMQQHGLSEKDLRAVQFKRDFDFVRTDVENKHVDPAIKLCGSAVAEFTGTQIWIEDGGARTTIFGLKPDAEMAEYLLKMLSGAMSRGWQAYLKTDEAKNSSVTKHKLYWAYRHGFAGRVNAKIQELNAEADKAQDDQVRKGKTDLIALKQDQVSQALAALAPHLKIRPGRRSRVDLRGGAQAYQSGSRDGAKVNLNRPVEGAGAQKKIAAG